MLTNYHTHHERCGHAGGSIEDYVKEAIQHKYTEIGISCHTPFERIPEIGNRMPFDQLEDYFKDIEMVKKKYKKDIKVLKSLEIEYVATELEFIKEMKARTDYLILAQHFIEIDGKRQDSFSFTQPEEIEIYAESAVEAMETGLFEILAHPDLFMIHYPRWDDTCEKAAHTIAKGALENDIILEVNANGFRNKIRNENHERGNEAPYPVEEFWSIVSKNYPDVKVIVNSDCHNPHSLNDEFMLKAREFAQAYGLNVLNSL